MEKIIEIDLIEKNDLVEKYDNNNLSKELLEYIIKESTFITMKDNIKIVINEKNYIDLNIEKIIKDGLQKEYNQNLKLNHLSNIKQILLLLIGIIFLIIWATIKVENIWKEVLLIIGWVPIWEAVDIKLFADMESKRRRTILKKLITSEIIIKSINLK